MRIPHVFLPLLLMGVCAASIATDRAFSVATRKPEDSLRILERDGSAVLLVTSPSGIGGATIKFRDGSCPSSVAVSLRYREGEPFRYLEGFIVRAGKQQEFSIPCARRRSSAEPMEVVLPEVILRAKPPSLELEWIDAYRQ
jgi:hypothetical protein